MSDDKVTATKIDAKDPRATLQERKNDKSSVYQFRITDWAQSKVDQKRKRKGYGELRPRKNHPIKQFMVNSTTATLGLLSIAPLERVRIIQQSAYALKPEHSVPTGSMPLVQYLVKNQGVGSLWRGA